MSSYPLVKFVDAPAANAVVRYDFNDQNPNPATSPAKKVTGFDPGVPSLEGDPDAVGQQWGFRSPRIVYTIKGTKAQALAALSAVSKEQLRRTNWLMFQLSAATSPRWFKTYRTGYESLSLEQVYVRVDGGGSVPLKDTWTITVPLVADAFAYRARETLSQFQVVQGPIDLAGPTRTAMRVVLPAIKGDAPTPLRVAVTTATGTKASKDEAWLVGCIAGSASMQDPVVNFGTADIFTVTTGSAPVTSGDATFFSGDYRTISLTTTAAVLTTNNFPITVRGRYKLLLRGEFTTSAAGVSILFAPTVYATPQPTKSLTISSGTFQGWVDLGEMSFPVGVVLPDDQSNTILAQTLVLSFRTSSGTGTAKIDAIKVIPVDGPTVTEATLLRARGLASNLHVFAADVRGTFDGDAETFWAIETVGPSIIQTQMQMDGGFPYADPAAPQNLLILMALDRGTATVGVAPYITTVNTVELVDVSYHPRELYVGDGT